MGKKLEHNGIWESSRMIIPQHKEDALLQDLEMKRIPKPNLDEQEMQLISVAISTSFSQRGNITLTVYDAFQSRQVVGVVTKFDQQLKRVRIDFNDEWEWINMTDITSAEAEDIPWI